MKHLIFKIIQLITFSRIFWSRNKNIYLTFDDGPHSKNTEAILGILDEYQAKATFFVVGEEAEKNIEILKKISNAGHTIANHSYSHIRYQNNWKQFVEDIDKCEQVLRILNIPTNKYFRVPYGIVSIVLLSRLLINGYKVVFWNKDTKDYKLDLPEEVSHFMDIKQLKDGDIVLLHDHPQVTPQILKNILSLHSEKKFSQL